MAAKTQGPYLVTGASGHLGRLVLDRLIERGVAPIIATTRSPDKLASYAQRGVEVRRADFHAPETLARTFAGARRLLLISTSELQPGERFQSHLAAIAAATEAGVEHIVYTSLTNPRPGSPIRFAGDHRDTEARLAALGISCTILRNNLYTDLFLMTGPLAISTGHIYAAASDGKVGYVTRADCAAAAAAALVTQTGTATYDITGPAPLGHADIAKLLSAISGTNVTYTAVSASDHERAMIQQGMPAAVARLATSIDQGIAAGDLAVVSSAVRELTGTAPTSVETFLRANAAALTRARG